MDRIYKSIYKSHIEGFIELKRKLGFKYKNPPFYLYEIDEFAYKTKQTQAGITREFAEIYSKARLNDNPQKLYVRVSMLAQLSAYISKQGTESYIPRLPRYTKSTFIPYIFNQQEITKIFEACDNLTMDKIIYDNNLFSIPLVLRLLYSTGIRVGEAKALTNDDVNIEERFIRVKDSKNGKERIIPVEESLIILCEDFLKYKKQLPLKIMGSDYFFIKLNGEKCGNGINTWFRKCLIKAGIKNTESNKTPRIHDLRHTFAVTSLAKMAESGIDLYAALPVLSVYLGHQSIAATEHYVRLTSSIFPDLTKDLDKFYLDVFPKFTNYENY